MACGRYSGKTTGLSRGEVHREEPVDLLPSACDLRRHGVAEHLGDRLHEVAADNGVITRRDAERHVLVRDAGQNVVEVDVRVAEQAMGVGHDARGESDRLLTDGLVWLKTLSRSGLFANIFG